MFSIPSSSLLGGGGGRGCLPSSGGKGGAGGLVLDVFVPPSLPSEERRESRGSNGLRHIPESRLEGVQGVKPGEKQPLEGDSPTDGEEPPGSVKPEKG